MTVSGKDRRELIQEIRTLRTHLGRVERRNAERTKPDRELPGSLEQFKAIFDDAPLGLYQTTPDGRILAANSALVGMLGYRSFDELARRNLENEGYEPACPRSVFKERIEREGKVIGLESAWKKSDGTTLYVRESAQAVRDKLGKTLYYQGTVEDVTEKKQAEQTLRKANDELEIRVQHRTAELERVNRALQAEIAERFKTDNTLTASELQYRTTLDAMGDAIHVVDRGLKVVLLNEEFHRWGKELGLDVDHSVGRTIFELFPFLPETVHDEYRQVFEDGQILTTEEVAHIAGKEVITETRKIPVRQGDQVVRVVTVIKDITGPKHAERQIRERARIIDSTTDSVIKTDTSGVVTLWNRGAERIFGYTSQEMIGQPISILYSEPEQHRLTEIIQSLLKGEEIATTEVTCVHKDGSSVELAISLLPLKDADGNVTDFVGISRDITEHKRIQEALRQSENRYRTVIENAGEGIIVVQDGKLRFVNSRHTAVTGRSQEESTSRPFAEFVHPDDREKVAGIHAARLRGEPVPKTYEFRIIDREGQTKWLENNGVVIEWEGRPASLNFLRDITERKLAEEALREREETIRALVETSRDWIWSVDVNGVHTYCNPAIEQILGYHPEELVGKPCFDFIHDNDKKMVKAHLPNFVTEKRGWSNLLVRWRHKDGSYRYLESNAVPIVDSENKIVGFRGVDRDVTERKKAEDELRIKATILENMIEGVHITDEAGVIVLTNPSFDAMFGYERGELIGRHVSILNNLPPEENARFVQSVIDELQTHGSWSGDIYNIKKDGTAFISSGRISTLNLSGKKYWISVQHDITERKRAEEDKSRLLKAIETAKESISITTPEGVIVFGNKAMDDLFGYGKGELIGQHVSVLTSGPGAEKLVREALTALEEKGHWEGEVVNKRKDGTEFITYATTSAVKDEKGNIINLTGTQHDITARRKAEEALRTSEERFRRVFEEGPIGMVLTSRDLKFFSANPAFCKMLGYTQEEMSSKTFLDVTHPAHRDADRENIEKMWRGEIQQYATKKRYLGKNGDIHWGSLSTSLIRGQEGEPLYALAMVEDITERERVQETLRETTGLLETIFAHTHILVACLDPQFNFVRVNRAYAQADGREPSFFVGRNHFELYPHSENEAIFRKVVELGVPYFAQAKPFEYAEHPERKLSYWDWSLVPIKQQDGTVCGLVLTLVNVTEQKKAEQALRESEERYRSFVQHFQGIAYRGTMDFTPIFFHGAMEEISGYTPDQFIAGKPRWDEIIHPDDLPILFTADEKKLRVVPNHAYERDYRIVRKDGQVRWVHEVIQNICDDSGRPVMVQGTIQDITDRKRSEEALRESETHYHSLAKLSPVGIFRTDMKGDCTYVNERLCQIAGVSPEEWLGGAWTKVIHPDDRKRVLEQWCQSMQEQGQFRMEYRYRSPDGAVTWVQGQTTSEKDIDGRIVGYVGTVSDITELKQAEQALREREATLTSIFRAAPVGIGLERGWVLSRVNETICEMLGCSADELIGHHAKTFYPSEEDYERVKDESRRQIREKGKGAVETRWKHRDGRIIDVLLSTTVLDPADLSTGVTFTALDITERKAAEQSLRESEEKFRSLAEQSPNMIFINKKGRIVYANRKCEEVMGYTREELYSPDFDFRVLVAPESEPIINESFAKHLRGQEIEPYDYCLVSKAGKRIDAINVSKLIRYEGGPAILGVVTDITERKKDERALRESQERLKVLFESAPDAIYVTDLEGRFVDGNRAAEEMVGFAKDELIGKSLAESGLLSAADLSKAATNLRKVGAGEPAGPREYAVKRKDGSMIDVEVRTFPVRIGDEMLSLGIARDVTVRKHAEQKLLEDREQLKSLASQLSLTEERERHRLACVLHDQIGQSLVISKIKLDQLRKSGISGVVVKALDEVSACLGQVIGDTRSLTFDLSYPILYELGFEVAVAEWLTEHIQEKYGIETDFEDDGLPKPLDDDIRALLFRNVRELLINVVKHAGAQRVKVTVRRLNDQICTSVEDDGVGFDAVEVTARAARKAEFGLFSIRERLGQLGGFLEVVSAPGRGTRITMTAPLKQTADQEQG